MDKHQLRRLVNEILSEAGPGIEHDRLKHGLTSLAESGGLTGAYQWFHEGSQPDVLRENTQQKHLLVGDAKDSTNEPVDNAETVELIQGYFNRLSDRIQLDAKLRVTSFFEPEFARFEIFRNVLTRSRRGVS